MKALQKLYVILILRGDIMPLQESGEMYLETIYVLSKKNSSVRSINVCEYMGFSKPSVSRAVNMLKDKGYLTIADDGTLSLTKSGLTTAKKIYERHTLLTNFFIRLDDACKIEHYLSDETFTAIKKHTDK